MKTETIHLRISPQEKEAVAKLAEKRGMTISELVLYLIRREMEKEQDV